MLNSSNAKAYAILAILFDQYGDNYTKLRVTPYANGREDGFHVFLHPNMDRAVSFSESRNTDSIVIYFGEAYRFNSQGNGPSEEMYKNSTKYFSGAQYAEAALWIKDYFEEEEE